VTDAEPPEILTRHIETKTLRRGELSERYAGDRELRREQGTRLSAARHELTPWPGEVRCSRKRNRWRPGDVGPCGLYLGAIRNDWGNGWHFVPAGPVDVRGTDVVFDGIPAPTKREWHVRHDRVKKPTWFALQPDNDLVVHCPRCGYTASLQKLTIPRSSI